MLGGHSRHAEPLRERQTRAITQRQALRRRQGIRAGGSQRVIGGKRLNLQLLAHRSKDHGRILPVANKNGGDL